MSRIISPLLVVRNALARIVHVILQIQTEVKICFDIPNEIHVIFLTSSRNNPWQCLLPHLIL